MGSGCTQQRGRALLHTVSARAARAEDGLGYERRPSGQRPHASPRDPRDNHPGLTA